MHYLWTSLILLATALGQANAQELLASPETTVQNFHLPDHAGRPHQLDDWKHCRLLVAAFLGVDCPLAKLYGARLAELARAFEPRGVGFLAIDSNQGDASADLARFVGEHRLPFPLLRDAHAKVADEFGARRTPEVFVLDERRVVRYWGRIDDQYTIGGRRLEPTRRDLATALEELLADRPVVQPVTEAVGCLIDRLEKSGPGQTATYCRDIAPILNRHCVACHRSGQIAPFALTSYRQVAKRARTIEEAVRAGRMPPWHANPRHGKFANDPRLDDQERQRLEEWLRAGCPEGDPADLPAPLALAEGWNIPGPDLVLSIPQPVAIPAQGVMEYQFIEVDPGFREDKWVRGMEIRPGNRKVVHHCNVFLKPPGSDQAAEQGSLGSFCLAALAPGTPPLLLPDGMAKKIPAGWRLVFVLHYVPIGSEQTDRTGIGLLFADPKTVRQEVATKVVLDENLRIPPRIADHRVEHTHRFDKDVLLLALFPHLHLRGQSFRYEAAYPDGSREVLLDVPRYDFNWQNRYVLAEPKRLPAGTTLHCVAHYDNSAGNPFNPDPDATVHTGQQSTDEMFNGYFEFALADQDLTREAKAETYLAGALRWFQPQWFGLAILGSVAALALVARSRKARRLGR